MIPYTLLVTSAGRPHLLEPTLTSLLAQVDHLPTWILIHDDAAFRTVGPDGRDTVWLATQAAVERAMVTAFAQRGPTPWLPRVVLHHTDPPRRLGLALRWLFHHVSTPYVLYTQDDFVTVRPLPIAQALAVMETYGLHQIRFNKRATLGQKDTWQGVWRKEESLFPLGPAEAPVCTVADHWYFQTGLWRTAVITAALAWCVATPERARIFARCSAELALNGVFDGTFGPIPGLTVPDPPDGWQVQTRAQTQRTYIWGPIGEDRYVRHIGTDPADWAGDHDRAPQELAPDKTRQAWAEIASYAPLLPGQIEEN